MLYPSASFTLDESQLQPDQVLREFGAQLRLARETVGLSQQDVASRAQMSQANLSLIERGEINVPLKTVVELAAAVGCGLLLQLIPTSSVVVEGKIAHILVAFEQSLLSLVKAVQALRPAPDRNRPSRPRRGRPQKN